MTRQVYFYYLKYWILLEKSHFIHESPILQYKTHCQDIWLTTVLKMSDLIGSDMNFNLKQF